MTDVGFRAGKTRLSPLGERGDFLEVRSGRDTEYRLGVSFMKFSVLLLPLAQLLWKPEDSSRGTGGLGRVMCSVSTSVCGILDLEWGPSLSGRQRESVLPARSSHVLY